MPIAKERGAVKIFRVHSWDFTRLFVNQAKNRALVKWVVRLTLISGLLIVGLDPQPTFSQDSSDSSDPFSEAPPPPPSPADVPKELPPKQEPAAMQMIEARSFAVTTLKRSRSLRMYQIEDKSGTLPAEGKILLLRRGILPIMGLKVMKQYPESRSFAAKRMLIYDNRRALDINENYEALEKIGESTITPPSPQDQVDLKELESPVPPPPPPPSDFPGTDSPPPPPDLPPTDDLLPPPPPPVTQDEIPLESHNALVVEEIKPLDPFRHWISATIGGSLNTNADGNLTHYMSAGARYGVTLAKSLFLEGPKIQDSLVLEAGASLYQVSSYQDSVQDSYTILPVTGTLRYNFQLSETFGLFVYGGVVKNFITASNNADIIGTTYLGGIGPAAGVGAYYTMGPSWNLRADLGYDTLALGLMLRF